MLSAFFSCYLWWLLAGALLGWLANWLLCKCACKNKKAQDTCTNTLKTHGHTTTNTAVTTTAAVNATTNQHVKADVAPLVSLPKVDIKAEAAKFSGAVSGVTTGATAGIGALTGAVAGTVGGLASSVTSTVASAASSVSTAAPIAAAKAAGIGAVSMPAAPIDVAAAKAAGIVVKGADDLEVIEGIGPKICALFHDAGQKTFAQVAKMTIPEMSTILDNAGPRFKLANPETWAKQADLAANNRWVELKTLQDNLTAGVTVQQDRSEL